jgi:molybdate transport system substrate-binding protein
MKKLLSLLLVASLCTAVFARGNSENKTDLSLNVFAAASLTEALTEIAELYKKTAPDVTLHFNFDSSGTLQTQIENGADADVFLSAGQRQMNTLASGGFINDTTRRNLLVNQVVLIVPQGSLKGITSFQDVMTSKVSLVALGNSSVPVGQYSEEIFRFLDGWSTVSAKASLGSNVKEVLSQVESASVDCGVVYSTDAATARNVRVVASAPEGSHQPVVYPVAVVKASKNPDTAQAFLNFLSSPEATAVFERIGFGMVR